MNIITPGGFEHITESLADGWSFNNGWNFANYFIVDIYKTNNYLKGEINFDFRPVDVGTGGLYINIPARYNPGTSWNSGKTQTPRGHGSVFDWSTSTQYKITPFLLLTGGVYELQIRLSLADGLYVNHSTMNNTSISFASAGNRMNIQFEWGL